MLDPASTPAIAPVAVRPMCANHPDRPSTTTCDRCGTFGCDECITLLGTNRLCAACKLRVNEGMPSLDTRSLLARGGLWLTGISHVIFGLLGLAMPSGADSRPVSAVALLYGLVAIGYLGSFIITIVLVCMWFHLAIRYTNARGASLGVTPAGAVWKWFIPFVNLVAPFDLTRRMLVTVNRDPKLVGTWQAFWILGNIVSNVGSRLDNQPVNFIASALSLGAAITAVMVVSRLTRGLTNPDAAT